MYSYLCKNKHFFVALLFVIVNLVWKFFSINTLAIDHDEPFTVFYSQMNIVDMYKYLSHGENNPLFFESILHLWTKIFGISPFSVRFLSVLFSSATVFFIYWLCIKNFNSTVAILASIIFTCSNYHLGFSHEARVYAMFALLTTLSMFLFLEFIKNPSKKNIILLSIINILLVYSHFFALFIPFVQILCCLLRKDLRRKVLQMYLLCSVIVLVGYFPMLFVMLNRFIESSEGTWLGPSDFGRLHSILSIFSNGKPLFILVLLIWVVAAILHIVAKKIKIRTATFVVLLWFFIPFWMMFLISYEHFPIVIPMFLDRYVIHTSIPFYLITAVALVYIGNAIGLKWLRYGLYSIFCLFMILSMSLPVDKLKMPEIVEKVNQYKTPETIVYVAPAYFVLNFCYTYNRSYFTNISNKKPFENLQERLSKENIFPIYNVQGIDSKLIEKTNRIIFIDIATKDTEIVNFLKSKANTFEEFRATKNRTVWIFNYQKDDCQKERL